MWEALIILGAGRMRCILPAPRIIRSFRCAATSTRTAIHKQNIVLVSHPRFSPKNLLDRKTSLIAYTIPSPAPQRTRTAPEIIQSRTELSIDVYNEQLVKLLQAAGVSSWAFNSLCGTLFSFAPKGLSAWPGTWGDYSSGASAGELMSDVVDVVPLLAHDTSTQEVIASWTRKDLENLVETWSGVEDGYNPWAGPNDWWTLHQGATLHHRGSSFRAGRGSEWMTGSELRMSKTTRSVLKQAFDGARAAVVATDSAAPLSLGTAAGGTAPDTSATQLPTLMLFYKRKGGFYEDLVRATPNAQLAIFYLILFHRRVQSAQILQPSSNGKKRATTSGTNTGGHLLAVTSTSTAGLHLHTGPGWTTLPPFPPPSFLDHTGATSTGASDPSGAPSASAAFVGPRSTAAATDIDFATDPAYGFATDPGFATDTRGATLPSGPVDTDATTLHSSPVGTAGTLPATGPPPSTEPPPQSVSVQARQFPSKNSMEFHMIAALALEALFVCALIGATVVGAQFVGEQH